MAKLASKTRIAKGNIHKPLSQEYLNVAKMYRKCSHKVAKKEEVKSGQK